MTSPDALCVGGAAGFRECTTNTAVNPLTSPDALCLGGAGFRECTTNTAVIHMTFPNALCVGGAELCESLPATVEAPLEGGHTAAAAEFLSLHGPPPVAAAAAAAAAAPSPVKAPKKKQKKGASNRTRPIRCESGCMSVYDVIATIFNTDDTEKARGRFSAYRDSDPLLKSIEFHVFTGRGQRSTPVLRSHEELSQLLKHIRDPGAVVKFLLGYDSLISKHFGASARDLHSLQAFKLLSTIVPGLNSTSSYFATVQTLEEFLVFKKKLELETSTHFSVVRKTSRLGSPYTWCEYKCIRAGQVRKREEKVLPDADAVDEVPGLDDVAGDPPSFTGTRPAHRKRSRQASEATRGPRHNGCLAKILIRYLTDGAAGAGVEAKGLSNQPAEGRVDSPPSSALEHRVVIEMELSHEGHSPGSPEDLAHMPMDERVSARIKELALEPGATATTVREALGPFVAELLSSEGLEDNQADRRFHPTSKAVLNTITASRREAQVLRLQRGLEEVRKLAPRAPARLLPALIERVEALQGMLQMHLGEGGKVTAAIEPNKPEDPPPHIPSSPNDTATTSSAAFAQLQTAGRPPAPSSALPAPAKRPHKRQRSSPDATIPIPPTATPPPPPPPPWLSSPHRGGALHPEGGQATPPKKTSDQPSQAHGCLNPESGQGSTVQTFASQPPVGGSTQAGNHRLHSQRESSEPTEGGGGSQPAPEGQQAPAPATSLQPSPPGQTKAPEGGAQGATHSQPPPRLQSCSSHGFESRSDGIPQSFHQERSDGQGGGSLPAGTHQAPRSLHQERSDGQGGGSLPAGTHQASDSQLGRGGGEVAAAGPQRPQLQRPLWQPQTFLPPWMRNGAQRGPPCPPAFVPPPSFYGPESQAGRPGFSASAMCRAESGSGAAALGQQSGGSQPCLNVTRSVAVAAPTLSATPPGAMKQEKLPSTPLKPLTTTPALPSASTTCHARPQQKQ